MYQKEQTSFKRATILYNKVDEAQKAIQTYNNERVFGGSKPLNVDFWVSKEEQKQEVKQRNDAELQK